MINFVQVLLNSPLISIDNLLMDVSSLCVSIFQSRLDKIILVVL